MISTLPIQWQMAVCEFVQNHYPIGGREAAIRVLEAKVKYHWNTISVMRPAVVEEVNEVLLKLKNDERLI